MIIAIASGKGGTGKTTIATNLAYFLSKIKNKEVVLLDCDVEEPNAHLFFDLSGARKYNVDMPVPELMPDKCTGCGICGDVCRFSAIVNIGKLVIIHPNMCHGCSACWELCPEDALKQFHYPLGEISIKNSGKLTIGVGRLNIGEMSGNRIIARVKEFVEWDAINIIDVPPGTSCPVVESLLGVDFVILAAEPTPFGLANLKGIIELVRRLGIPFGVVINRAGCGNNKPTEQFLETEEIPVLARIPDDIRIAKAYAHGELFLRALSEYTGVFENIAEYIDKVAAV